MKYLILAFAIAASASAQGKNGTDECFCAIGAAHGKEVREIYPMKGEWDHGCDEFAEKLCAEECDVRLKQMEEMGGWGAPAGKDLTVGNAACQKIGKDVKDLQSVVIFSVCKKEFKTSEKGFKYPLCCKDKKEVKC